MERYQTGLLAALPAILSALGCGGASPTADRDETLARLRATAADLRTEIESAERKSRALAAEAAASEKAAQDLASALRSAGISVSPRGAAISVTVASRILFEPGEASITPPARRALARIAGVLKEKYPDREIVVEGHTDSVAPKKTAGEFPTNWELSCARAVAVARWLVEEGALAPERVSAAAFADTRPVASNRTPEGRAENRRVEIVILPPVETTKVSARLD